MATNNSARQFVERLKAHRSADELKKIQRYFKSGEGEYSEGDKFIGVRMGQVFALAKEFIDMPLDEIEKLLESPIHEARAGGLSIMGKQARSKKRLKRVEKNSLIFISDVTTGLTIGTWLILAHST